MTYWIVLASWTLLEEFADIFLAFFFPFYFQIKTAVIIWLVVGSFKNLLNENLLPFPCLALILFCVEIRLK